jgi:peroxiredoxin
VPEYKAARNELRAKGIDSVLVYCVNDPAVMEAWAKDQKIAGSPVEFFSDTSGVLTEALGTVLDAPGPVSSLGGKRCKRFALVVDDGVVKYVGVSESPDDPAGDKDISASSAKGVLAVL